MVLEILFLNYTDIPKDLINIIVEYTECDCVKSYQKLVRIQRNRCRHCNRVSPTMCSHQSICNYCNKLLRFKDKKCKICHYCLVKDRPVFTCLECEDLIWKFGG